MRSLPFATVRLYVRQDVLRAMELMADGAVPAGELVTAILPLADGAQAFRRAASGNDVKVHLVTS